MRPLFPDIVEATLGRIDFALLGQLLDYFGGFFLIDAGGGGTVAQYMANRNITTIDAGVPVLSMHSPFETVGKLDCYMNYLGCKAVYNA